MDRPSEFSVLFEQARAGSEDAFGQLYERYGEHVRRVVHRQVHPRLRVRYDTVDFLQSVWKSVFAQRSNLPAIDTPDGLIGFLCRIARNKVIDVHRRFLDTEKRDVRRERPLKKSALPATESHRQLTPRPSEIAIAREVWQRLAVGLPERDRRILELRAAGDTYREIATQLRINERTVRRALDRLAQKRAAAAHG